MCLFGRRGNFCAQHRNSSVVLKTKRESRDDKNPRGNSADASTSSADVANKSVAVRITFRGVLTSCRTTVDDHWSTAESMRSTALVPFYVSITVTLQVLQVSKLEDVKTKAVNRQFWDGSSFTYRTMVWRWMERLFNSLIRQNNSTPNVVTLYVFIRSIFSSSSPVDMPWLSLTV